MLMLLDTEMIFSINPASVYDRSHGQGKDQHGESYKSTVNIMLHGGKSQSIPVKIGSKKMVFTPSMFINIVLNDFARTIKQRLQVGKEEVKLSLL